MAITDSANGAWSKLAIAQQKFTASGAVRDEVRSIVIQKNDAAITVTFPTPGEPGRVYFVSNESSTATAVASTLALASGITWDGTNQTITIRPGERLIAISVSTDQFVVFRLQPQHQVLTGASGAITVKEGRVVLARSGAACAATLAAPVAGEDDGKTLIISAGTAQAHTVTQTTPGFNNAGASADVGTFGGAIGDSMIVTAYNGIWLVNVLRNVTLA